MERADLLIMERELESRMVFMGEYGLNTFGHSLEEPIGKYVVGTLSVSPETKPSVSSSGRCFHASPRTIRAR